MPKLVRNIAAAGVLLMLTTAGISAYIIAKSIAVIVAHGFKLLL